MPQYSATRTFQTVDDFRYTSSWVGRYEETNAVGHHFHRFDEHTVLLCCGIQNVLEPLLNISDKNFATILWAKDYVVGQLENNTDILHVATRFWRRYFHVIRMPENKLFVRWVGRLTCHLKAAARRLFPYRVPRSY